jgi:hypothetical protein
MCNPISRQHKKIITNANVSELAVPRFLKMGANQTPGLGAPIVVDAENGGKRCKNDYFAKMMLKYSFAYIVIGKLNSMKFHFLSD